MQTSQQVAAAVALRALGKKVTTTASGAFVAELEPGFPAAAKLRLTDLIVAVDGTPVRGPEDVTGVMGGRPIGTTFRFTVKRAGKRLVVPLTTVAAGKDSKRGVVGVILEPDEQIHLPVQRVDRRGRCQRPVGGARLRARRAPGPRAERRPRAQDRGDR